jgi:hypothetical protein
LPDFTINLFLFAGYGFNRTGAGAGAAIHAFAGVNPALSVFFGDRLRRTLAVTGAAVGTFGTIDYIGHFKPRFIGIYNNDTMDPV